MIDAPGDSRFYHHVSRSKQFSNPINQSKARLDTRRPCPQPERLGPLPALGGQARRLRVAHLGRRVVVLDTEVHRYLAEATVADRHWR